MSTYELTFKTSRKTQQHEIRIVTAETPSAAWMQVKGLFGPRRQLILGRIVEVK